MIPVPELIARVTDSNATEAAKNAAYADIVSRFQDMAYGCAYAILGDFTLAEDAAQEAFIVAWRNLDQLHTPEAFPGWFKRIVMSQCNRLTRNKRLPTTQIDSLWHMAAPTPDPYAAVENAELKRAVASAITALPEHERIVTTLFYVSQYSQNDICAFLELPLTTIKKRLHSARKRLRERMLDMVRETLHTNRPSQGPHFAVAVRFFAAVETGQANQVGQLLSSYPDLRDARRDREVAWSRIPMAGETPLHLAADCGHYSIVDLLLRLGADAQATDGHSRTPLHCVAGGSARPEIAQRLIDAGADINAVAADDLTPLMLAAHCTLPRWEDRADHWPLINFLIERGANLEIFAAAALDKCHEMQAMLEIAPELVNARNQDGETPLHWAARSGYTRTVKLLLRRGAEPNTPDRHGVTPLHLAAQPGKQRWQPPTAALPILREHGAKADVYTAAILGDIPQLDQLLTADPNLLNSPGPGGATPLCLAAWNGQTEAVEMLLNRGAELAIADVDDNTPVSPRLGLSDRHHTVLSRLAARGAPLDIFATVALNDADGLMRLLSVDPQLVHATDSEGLTPLALALRGRNEQMAAILIRHQAPVDIFCAVIAGQEPAVTEMLRADPTRIATCTRGNRQSLLHLAAVHGHLGVAHRLIAQGALVDGRDTNGATPLHAAAAHAHTELVSLLLARGADHEAQDHHHERPLHKAVQVGDRDTVDLLLNRGATLDARGAGDQTPLHYAVEYGHRPLATHLLDLGADLKARNYWGGTALHLAALHRNVEMVELLVERDADLHAHDNWQRTPLHTAVYHGSLAIVRLLAAHGALLEVNNNCYSTPLHVACERGHLDIAQYLVAEGVDVNARSDWGRTPLHLAAQFGHIEVARLLLQHGALVNAQNARGVAALGLAAEKGHVELVVLLLKRKADTQLHDERGTTALHLAVERGHAEVVRALLQHGADIDLGPSRGKTLLHMAVASRNAEIVRLILERGADPTAVDGWNSTPLHTAARSGDAEIVQLLLASGAPVEARDGNGMTPRQQAIEHGYMAAAELLS